MKKIVSYLIAIFVMSMSVFAIDISIGATVGGWGPTFGRGDDFKIDRASFHTKSSIEYNMAFAPIAQIIGQIDFIPYLGMELGVGYAMKYSGYEGYPTSMSAKELNVVSLSQVSIPLFVKGQYEAGEIINMYIGVGAKFNFNIMAPTITKYMNSQRDDANSRKYEKGEYSIFDIDLSAVLGVECKVEESNYIGIRVGYDFNLLGSLKTEDFVTKEFLKSREYYDALSISLTYRYKFADL